MKKYVGIALALICVLSFASCGGDKKITLPEPKDISGIEVVDNTSEVAKRFTEQDEISKIIGKIKDNTKNTGKESVSDKPVNIDRYIIIKFHHKNAEISPSIAYLYNDKGISYIEQPYSGIWELKEEEYDEISISPKSKSDQPGKDAFQILYEKSEIARTFANERIEEYLKQYSSDYKVTGTAYGFATGDIEHFLVSYKCSNGITEKFYGYKISVNSEEKCKIITEGEEIAKDFWD